MQSVYPAVATVRQYAVYSSSYVYTSGDKSRRPSVSITLCPVSRATNGDVNVPSASRFHYTIWKTTSTGLLTSAAAHPVTLYAHQLSPLLRLHVP